MNGPLQLEEMAVGGIVLFDPQVNEVGERLDDALLQGTFHHVPKVIAALHPQALQVAVVMLQEVVLHARHKIPHLGGPNVNMGGEREERKDEVCIEEREMIWQNKGKSYENKLQEYCGGIILKLTQ